MAREADIEYSGFFSLPVPIQRLNPIPSDSSFVWESVSDATEYAKNSPVAYIGQLIYVQETGKYYKVVADGIEEICSDGGVQSDWEENDVTKESYILNRTHYSDEKFPYCCSDVQDGLTDFDWDLVPSDGVEYRIEVSTDNEKFYSYPALCQYVSETEAHFVIEGICNVYYSAANTFGGKNGRYEGNPRVVHFHILGEVIKKLDSKFIDVDESTIIVNSDGKLSSIGGGSFDPLTKDEILAICKMPTSEGEGGDYTEIKHVTELPTEGINTRTIYVLRNEDGTYTEYIYVYDDIEGTGGWDILGEDAMLTDSEIDTILK